MKSNSGTRKSIEDGITQDISRPIPNYASLSTEKSNDDAVETSAAGIRTPVSVVLPAYNEEAAIGLQLEAIHKTLRLKGMTYEILVVDDGSGDHTAEEARRAHARVIRNPENRGYGAALKTGIVAAKYETIVIIDADGTYPADEIPNLVTELEYGDMVVGARSGKVVHVPWIRRPAKWVLGWLANRVSGQRIPDLNSGLRAFRRACVKQYFPILSNKFSFTTTVTLALLADDYRVIYQPINYYLRLGKSKIRPRSFLDFTMLVLRMAMLYQPLRIFIPLAVLCGLTGALKVIYDIWVTVSRLPTYDWSFFQYPAMSTSSVLLFLVGLQLLLVGMVADAVLRRISQCSRPLVPSHAMRFFESHKTQPFQEEEAAKQFVDP